MLRNTEFEMKRIAVFGANGFIGKNAVKFLSNYSDYEVIALSRKFDKSIEEYPNVTYKIVDLLDPFQVISAVENIDVVIQLVSTSSPGMMNQFLEEDIYNNVIPHISFIRICLSAKVKRIIFLSSGGTVYGQPKYLPIDENHPTDPLSSHGISKLMTEKYYGLFAQTEEQLDYVILRVSNPFGPHQIFKKSQGLIAAVIDKIKYKQDVLVYGDGTAERDYIYIDDLMSAIVKVIETTDISCEIFNIGSGQGKSVNEIIKAMETVMGQDIPIRYIAQRNSDVKKNILDIAKAKKYLKWEPSYNFENALKETLRFRNVIS